MHRNGLNLLAAIAVAVVAFVAPAAAQVADRINDDDAEQILVRIERAADSFKKSIGEAIDSSAIRNTRAQDRIDLLISEFEKATDNLRSRFDDDNQATDAATQVFQAATKINRYMSRHPVTPRAHQEWETMRSHLDELARVYNVSWSWTDEPIVERTGDREVRMLLGDIERNADAFRASVDEALDRSSINGTDLEDELNRLVRDFEAATDHWKSNFDDDNTAAANAEEVLRRAALIDAFMQDNALTPRAQTDWATLRMTLEQLGRAYNVRWSW